MAKFFFDKGHGGNDPGAIGNGMHEAILTDKIVDYIVDALAAYENVEYMIGPRPSGTTSDQRLNPRTTASNSYKPDFTLSIHINAGGGTGYETFIYNAISAINVTSVTNISKTIHDEVYTVFKKRGLPDRGLKKANLKMVRSITNNRAALLEYGFIDNKTDAALLKQDSFLKELAEATVVGLAKAFNLKKKSVTPPAPTVTECNVTVDGIAVTPKGYLENGASFVPVRGVSNVRGHLLAFVGTELAINGVILKTTIVKSGVSFARSTEVAAAIGRVAHWTGANQTVDLR